MAFGFALFLSFQPVLEKLEIDIDNPNLELINGELFYGKSRFTGNLISFHSNNQLKSKIQYLNGKKHGVEKQWFSSGSISVERFYKNGIKVGNHRAWWSNGSQKFNYHFNKFGEYHGNRKEWYYSKQLFRDFNYINGKEDGRQRLWKLDGNIKANYEVVKGERFGLIGLKKCYKLTTNSNKIK